MSLLQSVPFDTEGNFDFDAALVEFVAGAAKLKLVTSLGSFAQTFASSSGFTLDSGKTEFTGGLVRQKAVSTGLSFLAEWTSGTGPDVGTGTITLNGGAAVTGGFLNLVGNSGKNATLPIAYAPVSIATLAFDFKPAYAGTPSVTQVFLSAVGAANANGFDFYHGTNGHLFCRLFNSSGGGAVTVDFGAWVPVSGTTYRMVLQIDVTTGATKLFIDGSQLGSTDTSTQTRTNSFTVFYVGADFDGTEVFNGSIKNLFIYNGTIVSHAAIISTLIYQADTVTLPAFSATGVTSWGVLALVDTNAPKYSFNGKYWDGSTWASSDGTYAQSASGTLSIAHIATLPLADTLTVKIAWSASNTVQMSVADLTQAYTTAAYSTTNPTVTILAPLTLDGLDDFTADITAVGSDAVKFSIGVASASGGGYTYYYWSGSAWVAANGTYTQTNTAAEIAANCAAFTALSVGKVIKVKAWLHSADGSTTPAIEQYDVAYNFFIAPTTDAVCIVYGWILGLEGEPVGGSVTVINKAAFYHSGNLIAPSKDVITANPTTGYWEIALVETASVGKTYDFKIDSTASGAKSKLLSGVTVPNQDSAALSDIAAIA